MQTIAVLNQKGGVGKTTTAVNLAAALAACGQRVLLIDLDPQAHATLHLGLEAGDSRRTVYGVLTGAAEMTDAAQAVGDHLAVVASHIDLAAVEIELADAPQREALLRQQLDKLADRFDYVFIDCPPSLGILTINALVAVDEVVIPLQPHFLALHGLSKLLETIQRIAARFNPRLRVRGVVLCLYETGTRLATEVGDEVDAFFASSRGQPTPWSEACVFQRRVRRNIRLAEAPSFGKSIFDYCPASHGAEDYAALADEMLKLAGRADREGSQRGAATDPVVLS